MIRRALLLAIALALASATAAAQCPTADVVITNGERYWLVIDGDTVGTRASRDKFLVDGLVATQDTANTGKTIRGYAWLEFRFTGKPCRIDTVIFRDTVYVPVPDSIPSDTVPPPPPVDSTPPDTVVTPPPDTVVVPPPDTVPAGGFRFVSAQQLADWQALKAANDPLYQLAATNCALTGTLKPDGTPAERYADTGLWCAWIAVVNNDASAAAKAIAHNRGITTGASGNTVREYFIERILQRDLLAKWLTSADRAVIDPVLDQWASRTILASDSDQMTGNGCGAILWDLAKGQTPNRANVVQALTNYTNRAAGGQWIESSEYNPGTMVLYTMCQRAYQVATGNEIVPGASQLVHDFGKILAAEQTPDLAQRIQWGDEQDPRDLRLYKRTTALHGMEHPWAVEALSGLYAKYGRTGYGSAEPWARALLYAANRSGAPIPDGTVVAGGLGQVFHRSGSLLSWAMAMSHPYVHHTELTAPFDVQVYRDGWLLTHPLGYGIAVHELAPNGVTYAGISLFSVRQTQWTDQGQGWSAIAGVTRGQHQAPAYPTPPEWLKHGHRVTVLLDNGAVIVRDSVDMTDPRTLPNYPAGFRNAGIYPHQQRIAEFDGSPWALWHMPEQPTVAGQVIAWTASNGVPVGVVLCSPAQVSVVDESTIWSTTQVRAGEIKWQARVKIPGVLIQVFAPASVTVSCSANGATVDGRVIGITSVGVTVQ